MSDENAQQVPPPNAGESWEDYGKRVAEATRSQSGETLSEPTFEGVIGGKVPKVDHNPQTQEDVTALGKAFAEYRAEVAALRQELQAHRPRTVNVSAPQETLEQRTEARLAAISEASHYCPGCGTLSKYPRQCVGPDPAHPSHKALEMVSTDELGGDPANHTKAPSTDPDQPEAVAA